MKLKNILIVVKDIEKSKQFYHDLFGLDVVLDNDGNMILTEGLVLQDEKIWKQFLGNDVIPANTSTAIQVLAESGELVMNPSTEAHTASYTAPPAAAVPDVFRTPVSFLCA